MDFYSRRLLKSDHKPCPPLPQRPRLPRQPPSPPRQPSLSHDTVFLLFFIVVAVLCFGCAYAFMAKYCLSRMAERRRLRRNSTPPILFHTQEDDFADEDHRPLDHHIWFINTIGLPQSVIDSIAVFKYKREEGLIDGTECSVCLNEFCEEENLRLLPKCSHAFHLPCIDTWLRSHKNCPVCRAPVVKQSQGDDVHAVEEGNVNVPVSQENMSEEAIRERGGTSSSPVDNPSYSGVVRENLKKVLNDRNSASCELVGNEWLDKRTTMEEGMQMQPIRRSFSMNAPIGGRAYRGVGSGFNGQCQGRIIGDAAQMKNSAKASTDANDRSGGSSSVHRSTRSFSFGPSLQKGPVSMKRSSSSGKIWSSRQWRSYKLQNSP